MRQAPVFRAGSPKVGLSDFSVVLSGAKDLHLSFGGEVQVLRSAQDDKGDQADRSGGGSGRGGSRR